MRLVLGLAVLVSVWVYPTESPALEEAEKGVYVDRFDEGALLDWEYEDGAPVEIVPKDRESVLSVGRSGEVKLPDRTFNDFALGVDVQGGGGIRFAGRYAVYLWATEGGTLEVTDREKPIAAVALGARDKRFNAARRMHRLGVVRAGALLRVYVDEAEAFQVLGADRKAASITLVAGPSGSFFDNLRIETRVPPAQGAFAVPVVPDNALVYTSTAEIEIRFDVGNASASDLDLAVSVMPFDSRPFRPEPADKEHAADPIIEFGVRHLFQIHTRDNEAIASKTVPVKAGSKGPMDVNLGKLPVGFHMLGLSFCQEGKALNRHVYPLAVFDDIARVSYVPPVIPVGVYTHYVIRRNTVGVDPLWTQTYLYAIALDLKRHGFNAVVACGEFPPATVALFNAFGVGVIQRGDQCLDHPGVIGTLLGDEPKESELAQYKADHEALCQKTDKPVITCCVGEDIGLGDRHFFWAEINPRVRAFRWYGVKKSHYGMQHSMHYKGNLLPFADVVHVADVSLDTPFWTILPAFGGTEHEAYFQYPSPAEMRGLMHLSVAYGAHGVLLWTYQNGDKNAGLVDPVTKQARGGVLDAAGEVAKKIREHATLLRSLKVGGIDARCPSPDLEIVCLHNEADVDYVYAINKNVKANVSSSLSLPANTRGVRDVYDHSVLTLAPQEAGGRASVSFELKPGEGRLFAITQDAAGGGETKEQN